MERALEEKFDAIMRKPGVVGVVCADQRGLCLGDGHPHHLHNADILETSDSSDDDQMITNERRPRSVKLKRKEDNLLSGSVQSASFNIIFQVLIRVFTFGLNAFILRYVAHIVLGICNVRLFLLYSSIMFLSREPFRRASQRVSYDSKNSWRAAINFIWLAVPNTAIWALFLGFIWCFVLSQPAEPFLASQYRMSVVLTCFATLLDSMTEAPYIVAKYFLFYKLRIVGETLLIVVRSSFLCFAVLFYPKYSVLGYAIGTVCGTGAVCLTYYAYFYFTFKKGNAGMPLNAVLELLPTGQWEVSQEMMSFTWGFYKQSVLKQILTEGERYLMTFFDILTFEEQGIYDLISNLGSLAARFVFLPIEENAYQYFAQSLQRRCSFTRREKEMAQQASYVLGNVVRLMVLIGLTILVFGVPYSRTLLFLYGGEGLSDTGPGTMLLRGNCVYIFIMAINGVTEAFTQAAMTQEEMDSFNRKLMLFSGIFVVCSFGATKLFGSLGFYIANSINMLLRVCHSVYLIRNVFKDVQVDPFISWFPRRQVGASFILSFLWITTLMVLVEGRLIPVIFGIAILAMNAFVLIKYDQELITFFVRLYKTKTA